ncbi:TIR domain-containing protein [Burkholderia stagnalis]|uniref:TIR domain-containing protein n=1 Tax=Burkholderia stagnalis TaxID=1503054 RepID=UPI000F5BDB02|nr:nucleotide-binding protein [Burkholderia stagnalis]RQP98878.1 hypothetical protein DF164_31230 [Burkholderia stagnalis]RQY64930.1 hypothetical protein DF110_30755 [Burkholderia stagnalis]
MRTDYYNLIVAGDPEKWNGTGWLLPQDRYLSHTDDSVAKQFATLTPSVIAHLTSMPALFACETHYRDPQPVRVGRITSVTVRETGYYFTFEFERAILPLDHALLMGALRDELDVRTSQNELSRTHWAVKQVDLYGVLRHHGLMEARPDGSASPALSGSADGPVDVAAVLNSLPPIGLASSAPAAAAPRPDTGGDAASVARHRVFLVHGHNVAVREEVARFISTLGLEPVILHEQANEGRTILSKFQDEASRAAYAVILITPDDRGGVASADPIAYQARARQNVVFEFGFFAGSLGLKHVCALMQGPVEKPSDIDGLVYVSLSGDWKLQLAKEMKAAGLPVDLNRL